MHSCQVCTVSLAHYGIEGASSFGMQRLRSPEMDREDRRRNKDKFGGISIGQ